MSQSPAMRSIKRDYLKGWASIARLVRDEGRSFSGRERHCFFLNTGQPRFAQASSVAGLDLIDDGRAVAVTDWDHDGDLDLWVTNRTGPRIRVLTNNPAQPGNFLSISLAGTRCNRDAIGARVEVFPTNDRTATPRRMVKSVVAGNSFLAQSSKRLHFGLGNHQVIERIEVHWPGDDVQVLEGLKINQHYQLHQSQKPVPQVFSSLELPVTRPKTTKPVGVSRARVLRPSLELSIEFTVNGNSTTLAEHAEDGAILLTLWETTCPNCLRELRDFASHRSDLAKNGLAVVPLHMAPDVSAEEVAARLAASGFQPADSENVALGNEQTARQLESQLRDALQKHRQVVLPMSILLNSHHEVVAVYKGPVSVEQLTADAATITADGEAVARTALPFDGQWLNKP